MTDQIASDSPYSRDTKTTLRLLAGLIIPASSAYGVPGADDEAIFADILNTGRSVADSLAEVAGVADAMAMGSLAAADADTQDRVVGQIYASAAASVRAFISLLAQCYYRDDRVMASLNMEARAPHPGGYEVEEGDWNLLEPVRARAPMYRT